MVSLSLPEAQLFRILTGFFGADRVVFGMSVSTVCGGNLPETLPGVNRSAREWAKRNRCLFTVVDHDDEPCMVVEFFSGYQEGIDPVEAEHQQYLPAILSGAGIQYVTISNEEFSELLTPESNLDFYALLKAKIGHVYGIDSGV